MQTAQIHTQAFIDGSYINAASGAAFNTTNPATGAVIASIAECREEDVNQAVSAARRAFEQRNWAGIDPRERKKILLNAADLMQQHREELARLETQDMGKPIRFTRMDIDNAIATFRYYAEAIDKIYGEVGPTGDDAISLVAREPLGVVAAIVPWNFPMLMVSWKVAPALATGNSVILKPAERSPLTAIRIASLLSEAGVPDGVFNVLPGFGKTAGRALGLHMQVDAIPFTGSTEVGKLFLQYSGQSNMKKVGLECGGKSPHIIMKDCPDLKVAAHAAADALFYNQGQVCTAGSRLYVESEIHDQVVELIKERAAFWAPNDPLDDDTTFGPIVDHEQMNRVLSFIETSHQEQLNLVLGGKQVKKETGGCYVEPTIFTDVTNCQLSVERKFLGRCCR